MKIIKNIIAFPFIAILEIVSFLLTLFTIVGGAVLIVVAFGLSVYSVYLMVVHMQFKEGFIRLFIAALCTPWGLPAIAGDIINFLENRSEDLKEWKDKKPKKKPQKTQKNTKK